MANPLICVFNPVTFLIDEIPSTSIFAGAGTAGQPIVLNAQGVIDPSLFGQGTSATAGELLVAGALVNLYNLGGVLFMQNAYAAATGISPSGAPYPVPAAGFVSSSVSISNTAAVQFSGTFTYTDAHGEFSAANIGAQVYLRWQSPSFANAGGITLTPPSGVGQLRQAIGIVVGFTAPNLVLAAFTAQTSSGSGVTSITAGTGLSGGTITVNGTIALANTAVTPGSYTNANITVDQQGRITLAANGSVPVTKTVRFSAGSILSGAMSTMQVVNFSTAFADNNYTADVSLELGETPNVAGVTVLGFTKQASGVGVNVWFLNNDDITHNVTIHVIAEHD